jgi:hypothetical protein
LRSANTNEYSRTKIFFRVSGASVATQFLSPLLCAYLMKINPWLPMLLGLGIQAFAIVVALFLPETMNYKKSPSEPASSASSLCSNKQDSTLQAFRYRIRFSIDFITSDVRIMLIIPAFLIHMLLLNRDTLLQYISTRYAVSLSQATVLISIRSGLIMLLLLIILPSVNNLFRTRWRFGPKHSDLLLSRASAVVMALGFLLIALAPSIPLLVAALLVNTFGWGLTLFLRSLMTSLVESHHVARLNTFVGVFDTIGLMIGSPLLAVLFEKGIEMGGMWSGLPFLVCSGLVAMIAIILGGIDIGREESHDSSLASQVNDDDEV